MEFSAQKLFDAVYNSVKYLSIHKTNGFVDGIIEINLKSVDLKNLGIEFKYSIEGYDKKFGNPSLLNSYSPAVSAQIYCRPGFINLCVDMNMHIAEHSCWQNGLETSDIVARYNDMCPEGEYEVDDRNDLYYQAKMYLDSTENMLPIVKTLIQWAYSIFIPLKQL